MRKKAEREPRESNLANGWTVEAELRDVPDTKGSVAVQTGSATELSGADVDGSVPGFDIEPTHQLSNGALVLLGVIGGLYLMYTWVWFSWANYYSQVNSAVAEGSGLIGAALQQIVFWAAPLAPALWFVTAYVLNRAFGTMKLALWLIIGAIVLVPLPALITGGTA